MKKQQSIYMVCPFCREVIAKCTGTDQIEVECKNCGKNLIINYRNNALTVRENELSYNAEFKG